MDRIKQRKRARPNGIWRIPQQELCHKSCARHKDNRTNNPGRIVNNSAACRGLIRATPHTRPKARQGNPSPVELSGAHTPADMRDALYANSPGIINNADRGGEEGRGAARRGAREQSGERIITTIKADKAHCRLNDKF